MKAFGFGPLGRWAASMALMAASAIGCTRDDAATIDVYAASSLADAFAEMEIAFESAHPGTDVRATFAGSQVLRVQIEHGAGADVFASANADHVDALILSGHVGSASVIAGNELVVITPAGDPSGIRSFADLDRAERLVLGTENVPVGAYARDILRRAAGQLGQGFTDRALASVVSEEPNARLVRAKVELGEADAAIVYRTDASGSARVRSVPIPRELNIRAEYVMAPVLGATPDSTGSEAWTAFVLSDAGQTILARHGFVRRSDLDS